MATVAEAYTNLSVSTQSPGKLLVMLYDRALRYLRQAIEAINARDFAAKGKYLGQTVDIIVALDSCMDMEAGGEITANMRALYNFMIEHLTKANTQCDAKKVQEVINVIETLRSAFVQIAA